MLNGYLYSQLSFSKLMPGDFHGKGTGELSGERQNMLLFYVLMQEKAIIFL